MFGHTVEFTNVELSLLHTPAEIVSSISVRTETTGLLIALTEEGLELNEYHLGTFSKGSLTMISSISVERGSYILMSWLNNTRCVR